MCIAFSEKRLYSLWSSADTAAAGGVAAMAERFLLERKGKKYIVCRREC